MLLWKLVNIKVSKQSILTKMKTSTIRKLMKMQNLEKMLSWETSLSSRRCLTKRTLIMKFHLSKEISRKRKTLWNVYLLRRRDWSRLKHIRLIGRRNRNLSSLQKTFKEIGWRKWNQLLIGKSIFKLIKLWKRTFLTKLTSKYFVRLPEVK